MHDRTRVSSGAKYEPVVGYCRAIRVGDVIHVSGTTSLDASGEIVGRGDAYAQTHRILDIIAESLGRCQARMDHVVRTRIYITKAEHWQHVGRAHGEAFRHHPPASTMIVVAALIHPDMLVEIEADAVVPTRGND